MSYKKLKDEVIGEIMEDYGVFEESEKSDWSKHLCRTSWHGKEAQLEVRQINNQVEPIKFGKGLALTEEGAGMLAELLVENGYGDTDRIREILDNR